MFVQICPTDALLSPEPGGDQGTLFTHKVVQGCTRLHAIFVVLYLFRFFRLDTPPPRGAAGSVTFRLRYLLFPHFPPPAVPVGLREIFGMTSHCLSACVPLYFDESFPCRRAFFGVFFFCHGAFSVSPSPRHTGGTRQGFDRWLAFLQGLHLLQLLSFAFSWIHSQTI